MDNANTVQDLKSRPFWEKVLDFGHSMNILNGIVEMIVEGVQGVCEIVVNAITSICWIKRIFNNKWLLINEDS